MYRRPLRFICDDGCNCRNRNNQENQEEENLSHPAWPSENANKVDDESNWINKQIANNYQEDVPVGCLFPLVLGPWNPLAATTALLSTHW